METHFTQNSAMFHMTHLTFVCNLPLLAVATFPYLRLQPSPTYGCNLPLLTVASPSFTPLSLLEINPPTQMSSTTSQTHSTLVLSFSASLFLSTLVHPFSAPTTHAPQMDRLLITSSHDYHRPVKCYRLTSSSHHFR